MTEETPKPIDETEGGADEGVETPDDPTPDELDEPKTDEVEE